MAEKKSKHIDPLYELFEHFLVTKSYEDSAEFTKQLAERYVAYLDSTPAHAPFAVRASLLEDLTAEAHEMLVKKMYGCMRVADYFNSGKVVQLNRENELVLLDNLLPALPAPAPDKT